VCSALGVELRVRRVDGLGLLEAAAPDRDTPCLTCARHAVAAAYEAAVELGAPWVFQGTNYFGEWKMVPRAGLEVTYRGHAISHVNLPYAFGATRARTIELCDAVRWTAPALAGVSTNCRLPGVVQEKLSGSLGHVPELEDLSLEVMVGHLSRAEALDELRRKAPRHVGLLEAA
jgi:hypothetical protein